MTDLQGYRLFNAKVDQFLRDLEVGSPLKEFPTIRTQISLSPAVLVFSLLDHSPISRVASENISADASYALALRDVLNCCRKGEVASQRELRNRMQHAQTVGRRMLSPALFDLLYGALQFYSFYNTNEYQELFSLLSGLAYGIGEASARKPFHHHVDHFKYHAAIFLSVSDRNDKWSSAVRKAEELLEEWGDQPVSQLIMVHAAHNLFIQCDELPPVDTAYLLVKDLRARYRHGTADQAAVFSRLNQELKFEDAYEILKFLWADMAIPYYFYTKEKLATIANEDEAVAYAHAIKFCSRSGIPFIKTELLPEKSQGKIVLSFPGGTSIGKTSVQVKYENTRILVDFGCDPYGRIPKWGPDLDLVDAVFITHAHQDHVGGLLHLYGKIGYQGYWYALEESRPLVELALRDSVKIAEERFGDLATFSEGDASLIMSKFRPIEERVDFSLNSGLAVRAYPAGHIHGSCQYLIKTAKGSVLVTGDFNVRTCSSAKPMVVPECDEAARILAVVAEGTYAFRDDEILSSSQAKQELLDRLFAATQFPVLVPVMSLGRAQEVLFALSGTEYTVGVFGLAKNMTRACQFQFEKNIEFVDRGLADIDVKDYDVLVASAGCLQAGPSRYFFNTHPFKPIYTILTGFLFPGTPAYHLSNSLDRIRYSAHSSHADFLAYVDRFSDAKKFLIHYAGPRTKPLDLGFVIPKVDAEYEL